MSLAVFLLFLFRGKVWGMLVLDLLSRFGRIHWWIHQVLNFSILGDFTAVSFSLHVIDLFRWLISFWFNFRWLCISRNLSISKDSSIYLNIVFQSSPWCLLLSPLFHF
jgi:hypothetical protein